jgi:hypothetical protein
MIDTVLMRLRVPQNEARLKDIAESTSAGVWRIKRAKIILGCPGPANVCARR